jgi:hypothetical protein
MQGHEHHLAVVNATTQANATHTMHHMMMMPMYFDPRPNLGQFLFSFWNVVTPLQYSIALIVLFIASIVHQFLYYLLKQEENVQPKEGYYNLNE